MGEASGFAAWGPLGAPRQPCLLGERKQRPGSQKPGRIGPEVLGASLALPTPRMAYEIVSKSETPITCIGPPQEGPRPTGGVRVHQPRGHPRAVVLTTGRHPPTNMPRQGHQGVTFYKSSTDTKGSGPDQVPRRGTKSRCGLRMTDSPRSWAPALG